jgi:hypothetical protein
MNTEGNMLRGRGEGREEERNNESTKRLGAKDHWEDIDANRGERV